MLQNAKSSSSDGKTDNGSGYGGAFQPFRASANLSSTQTRAESTPKIISGSSNGRQKSQEMAVADSSTPSTTTAERRKKKPYKELTLEEKVQLIRLAEENAGMSQASIAERYSIAKSNVCRILQRKQEYLRAYECAGFAGSRKRKLRGDPQQQHHHHQQRHSHQQHASNSSTAPTSLSSEKVECAVSGSTIRNDAESARFQVSNNQLVCAARATAPNAPMRTGTIIQRGNRFQFIRSFT
ncbi:unnamed protein product [Gongylonema pulchrum]|uniref:HTH psq-type domain-containing protein n=1 Tax=Gongylonema pulchrum TaxID=637853 RepID=A0A183D2X4_9BILA|nr:unnamed protein product [Gongylonema pulchrum]